MPLWLEVYLFSLPVNLLVMEFTPIRSQRSHDEPYVLNRRVTIAMFVWASIYMVVMPMFYLVNCFFTHSISDYHISIGICLSLLEGGITICYLVLMELIEMRELDCADTTLRKEAFGPDPDLTLKTTHSTHDLAFTCFLKEEVLSKYFEGLSLEADSNWRV
jgi:hypothetical protein